MSEVDDAIRAAFETWARTETPYATTLDANGYYVQPFLRHAWDGWQACWDTVFANVIDAIKGR